MYETIVANLDYQTIRRVTENGREYVVASAVILKPGILHGSRGPLYYPEEEVAKNPSVWNNHPVTNGHPKVNGEFVSVKDSRLPADTKIGFLRNDRYKDGKRRVDVWFDIQATNASDPRILPLVEQRKPVGLSTGLITDNFPVQNETWKGKPYTHVAKNYRPDHLAILVDQPGACSVKDGCGINVNSAATNPQKHFFQTFFNFLSAVPGSEPAVDIPSSQIENEDDGDGSMPSDKVDVSPDKACKIVKDGMANGHKLTDKQKGMFGAICGRKTKLVKNAETGEEEEIECDDDEDCEDAELEYNVETGEVTRNANPSQARDPDSGRYDHSKRVNLKKAIRDGSANLVEPDNRGSWVPVDEEPSEADTEAEESHSPQAVLGLSTNSEVDTMPLFKLTDQQRKTIRTDLTANANTKTGATWKDLNLNELSDDALIAFHRQLKNGGTETGVVNADGSRLVYDEKTREFQHIPAPNQTQNTQTNNCGCNSNPATPANNSSTLQLGALTPQQPKSMAEALEMFGTPQEKAVWNTAIQAHNQQKQALINQLLANTADANSREAAFNIYKDMDIPQLMALASAMPKAKPQEQPGMSLNFLGNAGFPTLTPPGPEVKPLRSPTYNFRATNAHS